MTGAGAGVGAGVITGAGCVSWLSKARALASWSLVIGVAGSGVGVGVFVTTTGAGATGCGAGVTVVGPGLTVAGLSNSRAWFSCAGETGGAGFEGATTTGEVGASGPRTGVVGAGVSVVDCGSGWGCGGGIAKAGFGGCVASTGSDAPWVFDITWLKMLRARCSMSGARPLKAGADWTAGTGETACSRARLCSGEGCGAGVGVTTGTG